MLNIQLSDTYILLLNCCFKKSTIIDVKFVGPDHITLQVRPHDGVSLQRWSVSEYRPYPAGMPPDVNETTYFVYYSHGETPATPWTFSLHFKVVLYNNR